MGGRFRNGKVRHSCGAQQPTVDGHARHQNRSKMAESNAFHTIHLFQSHAYAKLNDDKRRQRRLCSGSVLHKHTDFTVGLQSVRNAVACHSICERPPPAPALPMHLGACHEVF